MNHIRRIRRFAVTLAGLAAALLPFSIAAPPAFAERVPPPAMDRGPRIMPAVVHTVTQGGMPGWQITLIAAGTALLAAVLAVRADRAWATRRHLSAPGA